MFPYMSYFLLMGLYLQKSRWMKYQLEFVYLMLLKYSLHKKIEKRNHLPNYLIFLLKFLHILVYIKDLNQKDEVHD